MEYKTEALFFEGYTAKCALDEHENNSPSKDVVRNLMSMTVNKIFHQPQRGRLNFWRSHAILREVLFFEKISWVHYQIRIGRAQKRSKSDKSVALPNRIQILQFFLQIATSCITL